MTSKMLQDIGIKLKKLRKQIGGDRKEMAARLKISPSTYYKNECGLNFPSMHTLKLLSDNFKISMDWFIFNKDSMLFEEKAKREVELEEAVQKLTAELDRERKNLEEVCGKQEEELKKQREKTAFVDARPDIRELLEYMERFPIFYHEFMIYFRNYKKEKQAGEVVPGPVKGADS